MFKQTEGGTLSFAEIKQQAPHVRNGLEDSGRTREVALGTFVDAAISSKNFYDLMTIEQFFWADWMKYGKIGLELK